MQDTSSVMGPIEIYESLLFYDYIWIKSYYFIHSEVNMFIEIKS